MNRWHKLIARIDYYSEIGLKIVIISLIAIIVIQGIMQIAAVREVIIPTEHWEGRPLRSP